VDIVSRLSTAVAVLAIAFLLAGCGRNPATLEPVGQVRGQVVEVTSRNITEVESLRLRDERSRIWTFTTEGFVGFTPSHLREHQLFGQSVLVSYVKKGDTLVAVGITD
jgi:uncharacterized lipoprotein YajG